MLVNRRLCAFSVSAALSSSVWAHTALELDETVITASALGHSQMQMAAPVDVLEGEALIVHGEATLGETLQGLPGVRSSSFGSGAARPVIRGMDGPRVKVLNNGVSGLDASTMSPDHAGTSEPLLAQRIEVLKGPATLLYGGGAIGGVVNVVDSKIPTYVPLDGMEGSLELRANSVANEGAGVLAVTTGQGPFALRVEGVKRQADDYKIPGGRQVGSFNDTDTFNVGASYIGERGFLGLAYGEQRNNYGLLAHEHADCHEDHGHWHCAAHDDHDDHDDDHQDDDHHEYAEHAAPYIDMLQKRWDLRGELASPLQGFELLKLSAAHSDYRHHEKEGRAVLTRFNSEASEARVELTHAPLGGWRGVLGGQTSRRDFVALGEEAYVPRTLTHNHGLFLLEELTHGALRYEAGLRHEWQDIKADQAGKRRHRANSVSAGAVWNFAPEHSLGLSLSRTQRLPTAEELFAAGPHAATRTVELGNPDLKAETSNNIDLTLRKFAGETTYQLSVFRNQVDDYIYAADSGEDLGGGYREVQYSQADALFYGVEGDVRRQINASGVGIFGDYVRGQLRNQSGDLPRIPAARLGLRLDHQFNAQWRAEMELARVWRQAAVAEFERPTAGYNLLSSNLMYQGSTEQTDYLVFLKASNLLNAKIRNHSSYIKDHVLEPGRNFTLGVRVDF